LLLLEAVAEAVQEQDPEVAVLAEC